MNKAIIKVLHEVIAGDLSNIDITQGLCGIIEDKGDPELREVFFTSRHEEALFVDWEHWSGCIAYPVPRNFIIPHWRDMYIALDTYEYHCLKGTLYVGLQLKLRQDLCRYLLGKWEV